MNSEVALFCRTPSYFLLAFEHDYGGASSVSQFSANPPSSTSMIHPYPRFVSLGYISLLPSFITLLEGLQLSPHDRGQVSSLR
jgi:hypothetical protein